MTLGKIIRKTILSQRKNTLIICGILFIAVFMISLYLNYINVNWAMKDTNGRNLYGNYDIVIDETTETMIDKIASYEAVDSYAQIKMLDTQQDDTDICFWYYTHPDFFEMTEFSFLKGEFPNGKDEILCEERYLSKSGLCFDDEEEIEIKIGENSYRVTGTFEIKEELRVINEVYYPRLIQNMECAPEGAENRVYLQIEEENLEKVADELSDEFKILEGNIGYNAHYLAYMNIDESGMSALPWMKLQQIMALIIYIMLFYMLTQLIWMTIKKNGYNFSILVSQGIKPMRIAREYVWGILLLSAGDILFSFIFMTVFNIFILGKQYQTISIFYNFGSIFLAEAIFCLGLSLVVLILIIFKLRKNIVLTLENKEEVRNRRKKSKRIFDEETSLIVPLAENMIKVKRAWFWIFSAVIVLGMFLINVFCYTVDEMFQINDSEEYEYRIDYIYNTDQEIFLGINGMEEIYEQLKEQTDLFEIIPVYYQISRIGVKPEELKGNYKKYLENIYPEMESYSRLGGNGYFEIEGIVLGMNEEIMQQLFADNVVTDFSLSNSECYVISDVITANGTEITNGLEKGDTIKLNTYYIVSDEEGISETIQELKVIGQVDGLQLVKDEFYNMPIVLVNLEMYRQIADYNYPTTLYLNKAKGVTDEMVEDYFRQIANMELVNLKESNAMINSLKIQTQIPAYFMAGCLFLILGVNVAIALSNAYQENKKQLGMLHVLGVSDKQLAILQLYINLKMFIQSIIIGNLLSLGACYVLYLLIRDGMIYYEFRPPILVFLVTTLAVLGIFFVLTITTYRRIQRMNLLETLSGEAG